MQASSHKFYKIKQLRQGLFDRNNNYGAKMGIAFINHPQAHTYSSPCRLNKQLSLPIA
jgi:hypothetical protein